MSHVLYVWFTIGKGQKIPGKLSIPVFYCTAWAHKGRPAKHDRSGKQFICFSIMAINQGD